MDAGGVRKVVDGLQVHVLKGRTDQNKESRVCVVMATGSYVSQ